MLNSALTIWQYIQPHMFGTIMIVVSQYIFSMSEKKLWYWNKPWFFWWSVYPSVRTFWKYVSLLYYIPSTTQSNKKDPTSIGRYRISCFSSARFCQNMSNMLMKHQICRVWTPDVSMVPWIEWKSFGNFCKRIFFFLKIVL